MAGPSLCNLDSSDQFPTSLPISPCHLLLSSSLHHLLLLLSISPSHTLIPLNAFLLFQFHLFLLPTSFSYPPVSTFFHSPLSVSVRPLSHSQVETPVLHLRSQFLSHFSSVQTRPTLFTLITRKYFNHYSMKLDLLQY